MGKTWLINRQAIAKKIRNPDRCFSLQIKDSEANRECPKCHFLIDNADVSPEWPGLPAGVKFDPSDAEILEHLAAKCGVGRLKPHVFLDEFIPTLETDQGICYTHPENLPGVRKDGSIAHFFHKTSNAYATGQRKRRKINNQHSSSSEHVRWHKTGKTKAVMENGIHKGWKKIFSLYKSSIKGCKPHKSNWVMHQYHLGMEEDEKEGEYVVAKVSYQQRKQTEEDFDSIVIEDFDFTTHQTSPRTPKTNTPIPPRSGESVLYDDDGDKNIVHIFAKEADLTPEVSHAGQDTTTVEDDTRYPAWFAGESQAIDENYDLNGLDDNLLCEEVFGSCDLLNSSGHNQLSFTGFGSYKDEDIGNSNAPSGIADLENLELDTPPDFQLADLQFGSQDSIFSWLDRL